MYENLVHQNAGLILGEDILASRLPPALLFSGPSYAGKLTAALETARILSCHNTKADWNCSCSACSMHRSLDHPDLLLTGPRDCIPEIHAAASSWLHSPSITTRFLFIRSVRKLTNRFTALAGEVDDTKQDKALPLIADIHGDLEDISEDSKTIQKITDACVKLSAEYLYDSLPVSHVRIINTWTCLSAWGKHKVVIIENVDRMHDSARNAFLKVLEEPPVNVTFILTTSRRGAVMPTLLSRLRTYTFVDRPETAQVDVIRRVFHDSSGDCNNLRVYFSRFLPVSPERIEFASRCFLQLVLTHASGVGKKNLDGLTETLLPRCTDTDNSGCEVSSLSDLLVVLNKCKPEAVWLSFLTGLSTVLRTAFVSPESTAREIEILHNWFSAMRSTQDAVAVFNLSPQQALERLFRLMTDLM